MVEHIERAFPALRDSPFQVTSPRDRRYNCIAWAAGTATEWWWPDGHGGAHWPADAPRVQTIEAFRLAFATLGYVPCDDERVEAGYEKVALFALNNTPKHAARQLSSGRWTSKLGPMEDIEHELHDLTGLVYGSVVLFMKRRLYDPDAARGGVEGAD